MEKQYGNFTQYGGADNRFLNAQGLPVRQNTVTAIGIPFASGGGGVIPNGVATLSSSGNGIPNCLAARRHRISARQFDRRQSGISEHNGEFNSQYDFSDSFSLYAFGTYGHKFAKSFENDRLPNQIIATVGSNQPCSATNLNGYETVVGPTGAVACANGVANNTGRWLALQHRTSAQPLASLAQSAYRSQQQGRIVATGNAGNLFSSTLINVNNGAAVAQRHRRVPARLGTTPELVMYPNGFRPMEVLKEDDYQYDIGTKFNVLGWDVDANVAYGKDIDNIYTWNSGNRSLFIDTHTSPTNFFDGGFVASQLTGTIDATHGFNIGMASPLTVASAWKRAKISMASFAGDPMSYYKEGAQSFPGFTPSAAGTHSRKNYAGYIDLALAPIEELAARRRRPRRTLYRFR